MVVNIDWLPETNGGYPMRIVPRLARETLFLSALLPVFMMVSGCSSDEPESTTGEEVSAVNDGASNADSSENTDVTGRQPDIDTPDGVEDGDAQLDGNSVTKPNPSNCGAPEEQDATLPPVRSSYLLKSRSSVPALAPDVPSIGRCLVPPFDDVSPPEGAPRISMWTKTADPGDSIVIRATGLVDRQGRVRSGAAFEVYSRTGDIERAPIVTSSPDTGVVIRLPETLPERGVYILWAVNEKGVGKPVVSNRPELWWAFQDEANPGDRVHLFGRNLAMSENSESVRVFVEPKSASARGAGAGLWLETESVNPYRVTVNLPDSIEPGTYRVWLHNGYGGRFGWAGLYSGRGGGLGNRFLEVKPSTDWSDRPTFNIAEFGADGSDGQSDAKAIQNAVDRAVKNAPATVRIPEGDYFLDKPINNLSNIRIQGQGKDRTTLKGADDAQVKTLLLTTGGNVIIRDMKLHLNARPYPEGTSGLDKLNWAVIRHENKDYHSGLKVQNVHINAQHSRGFTTWKMNNDVVIRNSKIAAKENQFGTPKNSLFENNTFLMRADGGMAIYTYGGWNLAVIGNEVRNYEYSKSNPNSFEQGVGRFYTCTCQSQRQDNLYIGENETENLTVRPGFHDQNMGEQIMWESKKVKGVVDVSEVDGKTVSYEGDISEGRGWYMDALITSGPGAGQSRQIATYEGSKNRFDITSVPWRVPPEENSTIRVLEQINRIAVYGNDLDAKKRAYKSENHIADSGVQPFLPSYGLIVENNRFHEIRTPVPTWSSTWKLRVVDNHIDKARWGVSLRASNKLGGQKTAAASVFGSVIRGNRANKILKRGYWLRAKDHGGRVPGADLNIVEGNKFENLAYGFHVGSKGNPGGARRTVIVDNEMLRGNAAAEDSVGLWYVAPEAIETEDNHFEGFSAKRQTPNY
jgi:hypothetical protein